MKKLLIVCRDNESISPMIQVMLAKVLRERGLGKFFMVESAGLLKREGALNVPATTLAIRAMTKQGLDIAGHRSRCVWTYPPSQSYYKVFVTGQEIFSRLRGKRNDSEERTFLLSEGTGGIFLPPDANEREYAECVACIRPEMEKIAESLAEEFNLLRAE